jgi:sialidase-1
VHHAKHIITAEDMTQGYFLPEAVFSVTASATPTLNKTMAFADSAVALRDGLLSADIKGSRNDSGRDLATQPYVAGEAFPYKFDVTNTSLLTEKVVPRPVTSAPSSPTGQGTAATAPCRPDRPTPAPLPADRREAI